MNTIQVNILNPKADIILKDGVGVFPTDTLYGVVARLALLAASLELERTDPDMEAA